MTTRRKTRQSALKCNKTEESSSSESEYSKTLKIITKLSQKYLSTTDSKKKPSSTRERSKRSPDKAYDGDEENTSPDGSDSTTSVSSKSKSSLYDFDEEDPEPMTSSLKKPKAKRKRSPPLKTTVSKSKSAKSKGSSPKITPKTENKSSVPKKSRNKKVLTSQSTPMDTCPVLHSNSIESPINIRSSLKVKNVSFSPNVSEIIPASFTPVVSLQRLESDNVEGSQRQLRKRKNEPPSTQTVKSPKIKKVTPTSKDKLLKKEKSRDSGMYLSPEVVAEKDFKARAVSTPFNPALVPIQTSLNTYRDPALLNVSPVKKTSSSGPVTPLSDYASMDSITHQLTFDDSMTDIDKNTAQKIELFTTEEDLAVNKSFQKSYKPAKRKLEKRKAMKANAKVDEWMEKMNTEFSEIEGFELSIEDNA